MTGVTPHAKFSNWISLFLQNSATESSKLSDVVHTPSLFLYNVVFDSSIADKKLRFPCIGKTTLNRKKKTGYAQRHEIPNALAVLPLHGIMHACMAGHRMALAACLAASSQ